MLRKVLFWVHLCSGVIAGVVIAVMSITGIAIAFEDEILAYIDRDVKRVDVPVENSSPLAINQLRRMVEAARPAFKVSSVTVPRDPQSAYEFYAGRDGPVYVDPYTGSARESRTHEAHAVIHELEEWHRWLGAKDGPNSAGRVITGVSNLAFLILCLTGLYLWFPRKWSWRAVRPKAALVTGYKGKARDYNWHHVFGIWSLPVLVILVVTAVPISFEWGHRLVFTLFGETAPIARNYGMMALPPITVPQPPVGAGRVPVETLVRSATELFPEWVSLNVTFPDEDQSDHRKPISAGLTVRDHMPSRAYIPIEMDPYTGTVLRATRFEDRSTALQTRVWFRFLHTGGAFGVPGKVVATLATVASLILVWTGLALTWRRFFARRRT